VIRRYAGGLRVIEDTALTLRRSITRQVPTWTVGADPYRQPMGPLAVRLTDKGLRFLFWPSGSLTDNSLPLGDIRQCDLGA
jgi:hypothetical protein